MKSKDIKNPRDPLYSGYKHNKRVFIVGFNGTEVISDEEHNRRLKNDGWIRIRRSEGPIRS